MGEYWVLYRVVASNNYRYIGSTRWCAPSLSADVFWTGSIEEVIRALSIGYSDGGVGVSDVASIDRKYTDPSRIEEILEQLENDDSLKIQDHDYLDIILAFSVATTESDIVEIGQALIMDAVKFIVAYRMLFPQEFDFSIVDRAVEAYFLPQFDFFMPKLRKSQTINRESDAGERFDDIIDIARGLKLTNTAEALEKATESLQVL